LDSSLTELLYAYYPRGGFYRRHRDAIPGSASVLRTYSLLLYLNKDWTSKDGGELLLHLDSGGDELPDGEEPNFVKVEPKGGTLVLFKSERIPHEVLDTNAERLAVVGWYNRPLTASDLSSLGGVDSSLQPILLGISAALVTLGVINLVSS
jgi:SM-20-related protein